MIACGAGHSLLIDPDGAVRASGRNNYGQLGLGHTEDQATFCPIAGVHGAIQVAAGSNGHHSAILDNQGALWMFRWNNNSQSGFDATQQSFISVPTRVQNLPLIIMVSCGLDHTVALDNIGHIWGVGNNSSGQLSIGGAKRIDEFSQINVPNEIGRVAKICCLFDNNLVQNEQEELWLTGNNMKSHQKLSLEGGCQIQSFSCGSNHIVVLDSDGGVWTVGVGYFGLGSGRLSNNSSLSKLTSIPPITRVECGACSTVMVGMNRKFYVCGDNSKGQLGTGQYRTMIPFPKSVSDLPVIVQGSANSYFSLLLDEEGRLWASGDNSYGQHGTGNSYSKLNKFVQVEGIKADVNERRFRKTKRAEFKDNRCE